MNLTDDQKHVIQAALSEMFSNVTEDYDAEWFENCGEAALELVDMFDLGEGVKNSFNVFDDDV